MTLNALWRLIRMLFVALGAPAALVVRVWRRDQRGMQALARLLNGMRKRGLWLRYDGEDEATVAQRIARLDWIARDPKKAVRHMARVLMRRGCGGFQRWRIGAQSAPVAWTPPWMALAALPLTPDVGVGVLDSS